MIHIIPEVEKELHRATENCICGPVLKIDPKSGEMVWYHKLADPQSIIENLVLPLKNNLNK